MQDDVLRTLETLSHQRLNLVKLFSAQSAAALQCLDGEDVEGFVDNIEKGDALIPQIDKLTAEIEAILPRAGAAGAAIMASDGAYMAKLLRVSMGMNRRMEARARALSGQLQEQISRIRANQKLRSRYVVQSATSGARINYTSK